MTKYTTTNHGWIKAGIILSVNSGHKISLIDGSILGISKDKFNEWIHDGWVQKVQEPEFTQDEMNKCVCDIVIQYVQDARMIPCMANFNDGIKAKVEHWKKERP